MVQSYGVQKATRDGRFVGFLLSLYMIAVLMSVSAMEAFSTLLGLAIVFTLVRSYLSNRYLSIQLSTGLELLFALLFVVVCIGVIKNPTPEGINWRAISEIKWIALLYILVWCFRLRPPGPTLIFSSLFVGTLIAAYAISQFFWGIDIVRGGQDHFHRFGDYWRSIGFFNNPMTFAHSFGQLLFLPAAHLLNRGSAFGG